MAIIILRRQVSLPPSIGYPHNLTKARFAHTHQSNPDFVKLADAMGLPGRRCIAPDDVEASLKWLCEESGDGPALLEVMVSKKEPVLPMVPAGKALHEFLVYDKGESSISL